ncbi:MAG: helical backbone metal receptor [Glaciecola sp.]
MKNSLIFVMFACFGFAQANSEEDKRIISLSPHLSEIVFALEQETYLVAVSDFSDYPYGQGCRTKICTQPLPSVSSYQGADIASIVRLKPSIILAWEGGNKAQDLARLEQLGFTVYRSSPQAFNDVITDIERIGKLLNATQQASKLTKQLTSTLADLTQQYKDQNSTALYYMSQQPLSGVGNDRWINNLLAICGIQNIYADTASSFSQFSLADIIRKQPSHIIAALSLPMKDIELFWAAHTDVFAPSIIKVNPDALHRFTPRVLPELAKLCKSVYL